VFNVYQEYPIKVKAGKEARDALRQHLTAKGILTRISFPPVHLTHFYRNELGYDDESLEVTEKVVSRALTLPMYPSITKDEMDEIAGQVRVFFKGS
jgi:dTDP-4-amino-4,6-dideoxygalactose transaminase